MAAQPRAEFSCQVGRGVPAEPLTGPQHRMPAHRDGLPYRMQQLSR